MYDYTEDSVVTVYDHTTSKQDTYKGMAQIKGMFEGLFKMLSDLSNLGAPVVEVHDSPASVFLIWSCPASGVLSATDTFFFDSNFKITRQNVVITSGEPKK